tara:strand:- start:158 stop:664 length:507 start_codon:yes stop_codon:yes gene_type:complete
MQSPLAEPMMQKHQGPNSKYNNSLEVSDTKIQIVSAWARASIGNNGVAYVSLINHARTAIKLIEANTSIAERADLHQHQIVDNILKMQHLSHVEIKSGEKLKMQPGGMHVMLFGLKDKIRKGDKFFLNLIFENKQIIKVLVSVHGMSANERSSKMNNDKTSSHGNMKH